MTITATVTSGATGSVTFYDGGQILGVGAISGTQASITSVVLKAGTRSLRAYYRGDATYAASTSPPIAHLVLADRSLGLRRPTTTQTSTTNGIAIWDFNGDGKQDYAASQSNTVKVFLGNGDGTFQTGATYTMTGSALAVAAGDLNGDGKADLVVGVYNGKVGMMLGNGDGTFNAAVTYPGSLSPSHLAIGDFNEDGKADVAASSTGLPNINVFLGSGDGTLAAYTNYSAGSSSWINGGLAAEDITGDGHVDLVAGTATGVAVFAGTGSGQFAATPVTYALGPPSGYYTAAISVGDFNADGRLDVAASHYYGVYVFLGKPDGTLAAALSYAVSSSSGVSTAADFDGDGKLDLAMVASGGGSVNVLFGDGQGSFRQTANYAIGSSSYSQPIVTGEFNGDGRTDLFVAGSSQVFAELLGGATPDLSISVTRGGGLTQGQTGALYTIQVTNAGEAATSEAVGVVASLPAGFTVASMGGDGWTCVVATAACARSDARPAGAVDAIALRVNIGAGVTGDVSASFTVSGGGDANLANNSVTDSTFVRRATSIGLTSSPNPSMVSQTVSLTATVTAGATGAVVFYDGSSALRTVTLSGGSAVLTVSTLPSGVRTLRAAYLGDGSYGPNISAAVTHTVTATASNGVNPAASYKMGSAPQWVGQGDFNGDGKADIVTVSLGNGSASGRFINVLLGNGDGTLRAPSTYAASTSPISAGAVIADFNLDGKPDVVSAGGEDGIVVNCGNGDGTFAAGLKASENGYFLSLATADFDRDGKPDLAAIFNNTAVVLLGKGDGTFQPRTLATPIGVSATFLRAADMNGDGKSDLITNTVSVLLGNGDGTFQNPIVGSRAAESTGFSIDDFNGDGKPDVAIVSWGGIFVLPGNGDGTFQAAIQSSTTATPGYSMTSGDFNGDGKRDLGYGGYYSAIFAIELGKGDGTFQSGGILTTDSYFSTMAAADLNGDGRADYAIGNSGSNSVNVFLGGQFSSLTVGISHFNNFTAGQTGTYSITVRNPTFTTITGNVTVTATLPAGLSATALSSGDYYWNCVMATLTCTRTGMPGNNTVISPITLTVAVSSALQPQTVVVGATASAPGVSVSATDPTFIVARSTTTMSVSPNPADIGQPVTLSAAVTPSATGRALFTADGAPLGGSTLLTGSQASFTTKWLLPGRYLLAATYNGDSTRSRSISSLTSFTVRGGVSSGFGADTWYSTGVGPTAVVTADVNGDGKADLVTANSTANTVSVLLGSGNGAFGAATGYAAGTQPVALLASDFNNDAKTDIAVVNNGSSDVSILIGNGDGTFRSAVQILAGYGANSAAAADFNGDGNIDVIVGNQSSSSWSLLLGRGDGNFDSTTLSSYGYTTGKPAVSDVNKDGKPDLVWAAYSAVNVMFGRGDGTFDAPIYSGGNQTNAMALGDLNGDGNLDVVTTDYSGVNVMLGTGTDGRFQYSARYTGVNEGTAILCADVNGDGKLDVVAVSGASGSGSVTVFFGNGNGTLQPAISYTVGGNPRAVAGGDFNGDGRVDLAVTSSTGNRVSILPGVLTPILTVSSSHTGAFGIGQTGAVYNITVTNNGPGTPSGTVLVSDTLPSGLTATSIAGDGWSCVLATLACTRSDSIASGAAYPVIRLTVNVTLSAPGVVVNSVSVSGGGAIGGSALDTTLIATPSLTITKSHQYPFLRGQASAAYTVIVSNQATGGPTVGTVTVTDTLPAGLTPVSMAGNGWNCASATSCTRSDALLGSLSYPPITVTVGVASGAPQSVTNQVAVSGGGSSSASATDPTVIYDAARLTAPAAGSTLAGSTVTFTWTAAPGATAYWLDVGPEAGQGSYFGKNVGMAVSQVVTGIPLSGRPVWARLWMLLDGRWSYLDYSFTAATGTKGVMTTPAPGSTLSGASATFGWTAGTGATAYYLDINSACAGCGGAIYGRNVGAATSQVVTGLPLTGATLYVRLWSLMGDVWQYNDYTYVAAGILPVKAAMTSPAPGTTLSGSSVTFTWTAGAAAAAYWLDVGTAPGNGNYFGQNVGLATSRTVTGIPTGGQTVYVRLWTLLAGIWQYNDYTYTAASTVSVAKAGVLTPPPGTTLTGSTMWFSWNAGSGALAYWLDVNSSCAGCGGGIFGQNMNLAMSQTVSGLPVTGGQVYVRLWTQFASGWQYNDYTYTAASTGSNTKAAMLTPAPGSTLAGSTVTFTWNAGSGAMAYWLDVNSSCAGCGGGIFGQNMNLAMSQTVSGLPVTGGQVYVRLWTQFASGWQYNDYTYTAASTGSTTKAAMLTPAAGSTLAGSTVTFTWNAGSGAMAYWLDVNSSCAGCGGGIFGENTGLTSSRTVPGLPSNGAPVYVRLWTQFASGWQYNDYTYTASGAGSKAAITSPTPGVTLSGATATFTWSAGSGATAYWLDVGSAPGYGSYFGQNVGLSTSRTVTGLPTNGSTVYVRLWTQFGSVWQYNDYSFIAFHN